MERFACVEKISRCAGAAKGGSDFASDQPRFAHSGDGNTAFAAEKQLHCLLKAAIEAIDQVRDRLSFNAQNALRRFQTHRRSSQSHSSISGFRFYRFAVLIAIRTGPNTDNARLSLIFNSVQLRLECSLFIRHLYLSRLL